MANPKKKVQRPPASRGVNRAGDGVPGDEQQGRKRARGSETGCNKPSLVREAGRKNDALIAKLRDLALKQQRDKPQVFISVREAARAFNVSASAMGEVYRRLGGEGLLSTVRSSRTMLRGKSTTRTLKVRGVIGIPVSAQRFLTLRDYRDCFQHLREELFARGFVNRCLFFEQDADAEFLVSRFADANADTVVWLLPDGSSREAVLRLRDRAIQFIGVSFAATSDVFCRYQVRRRHAIGAIFRSWRQQGRIRAVTIVRLRDDILADGERTERLEALAAAEQIECEVATLPQSNLKQSVSSLCADTNRGLVMASRAASVLAWQEPEAVGDILGACRVALIDGPIDVPVLQHRPDAFADVITIDWRPIAERIASDVATGEALADPEPIIFEAKPLLRVPLRQLIQG